MTGMKKNIGHKAPMLAYQFAFGSDERLYTVAFKGILTEPETRQMFGILRKHVYREFGEVIYSFLESRGFPYTDFSSNASVLEHSSAMASAEVLLHAKSSRGLYGLDGNADIFYAVMDHQKQGRSCCEGCCYAVMKTAGKRGKVDACYIIGQTFQQKAGCTENSYFSIRTGDGHGQLYDIESTVGEPTLPTFGSVDMVGILMDIKEIRTVSQAVEAALYFQS
ncbi:MAG TPA: hypothetical protein DDY31_13805 [Lachnospiraceae bacterium]|nr:hypothetical protein [Lachnospiraceae bacterium]